MNGAGKLDWRGPFMQFSAYSGKTIEQRADCLVVGVYESRVLADEARVIDRAAGGRLRKLLQRGDFAGHAGDSFLLADLPGLRGKRLLLVGLGPAGHDQPPGWERALRTAAPPLARPPLGRPPL